MPLKKNRNGNSLSHEQPRMRILITNGRFPVSLDLARQFYSAGHTVHCVDPMDYHVCKFSIAVSQSRQVPAPHDDPQGYIQAVKEWTLQWKVDMIIPIHEEVFVLAGCSEPEILERLFAPPFDLLVRLHHKYGFSQLVDEKGFDVPEAYLCKSMDDVMNLPLDRYQHGMALKPCFGRAASGLYHLRPGEPIPEDIDIGPHNHFIAQEWLVGNRFCSYSIVRSGRVEATGLYPVLETIDGSSSVFFQQRFHGPIYDYINKFVASLPGKWSGQIAFDFIETQDRLVAIECNPRSTSGLHLWSNTPFLARAITGTLPKEEIERPIRPPKSKLNRESHSQVAAGMLMWEHKTATLRVWAQHMKRLVGTRDVIWKWRDPMPTVAQPFLLTEYYRVSRRTGQQLPVMFQEHLIWKPKEEEQEKVQKLLQSSVGDAAKGLEGEEKVDSAHDHRERTSSWSDGKN
ncbi:ATP-grasp domain-domain-containing [Lecanosticta acicola]|uniref:ATP-grasp domain-domain-containing n=1 Tax=Lecanosticta acicola TaxID=111012 RepID=A0AAI8YUW3_9PEZI|nr:ATP-grasp domain-domain-containing [Lecanosticta acicola]